MANPIPDVHGGNRVFFNDVEQAGLSTMVGDMAAMNLRLFHLLADDTVPAAQRPHLEDMRIHSRRILDASNLCKTREQATRELRPITRVPVPAWGPTIAIANIRMNNIPIFRGDGSDTLDVVRWINRIFTLAEANTLTYDAAINLLIQGAGGSAADCIEQMKDENRPLNQIVQQLEMRFGDLCAPEEAKIKCNNMLRKDGEGLPEFIDRLRAMTRMACRTIDDQPARRAAMDAFVEGNIKRVLSPRVRTQFEERVINRSRMGLPAFTAREVEKECLDLERRRDENRSQVKNEAAAQYKRPGRVMQCSEEVPLTSDEADSSADEADVGDEATYSLICLIKEQERKYARKGYAPDPKKAYRSAFRKFNEKHPPPKFPRNQGPYAARAVAAGGENQNPNQGPPNKLDSSVRRTINELLTMANVTRGHCIQCGQENHYMHSDACALKDKVLVDRPCMKCGQGLHSADDCLRVFQRQYVAPQGHQINQLPDVVPLKEQ